ncbi:MAG: aminodeoxychorismate synthase component I [Ilumatobacteraceae bacterium]
MIRLDDLTEGGVSWSFDQAVATGRADRLADVVDTVREAEARRANGEWVVLVIAYEAASAFDSALRTAPAPPPGVPHVWWQSFAERRAATALAPIETRVTSRRRRANRWPHAMSVESIRDRIAAGDVYQVNLTDRFEGEFDDTALEMYAGLVGVQSCAFGAYIEMGDRTVVSASPELFFSWSDETVTCRPMKGTAPRQPRPDADDLAAAALVASAKERAENVMIVDLLRNDLGRIARTGSVRVPDLFTRERYETVWQLTSTVQAQLPPATGLVDVLRALFPCGSITGAPKVAAMEIITELETEPRGVYCGAIGVLAPDGHGPRAVFSVPIRTAVVDPANGTYEYGAGGGITWSSKPDAEDAEVRAKARILTRSHRELDILETLRNDDAGLRHMSDHVDRMEASARWFGHPFDRDEIEGRLADLPASAVAERVRLLLDRTGALRIERHPLVKSDAPVVLAIDTEITRSDDPYCCHKTTWRRQYDRARQRHPGADDVVMINEHGRAVETTIANLLYRLGECWYCPPLTDGGLPGIARRHALDDGLVVERSIAADDLRRCDELAVINDLRGWRPARLADDH